MPFIDFFRKTTVSPPVASGEDYDRDPAGFAHALKERDTEATLHLYRMMARTFLPYARQRSPIDDDEAEEILCEALAIGLNNIIQGKYQYQGVPVVAYMFKIAKNQWLTYLKEREVKVTLTDEVADDSGDADPPADNWFDGNDASNALGQTYFIGQISEPDDDSGMTDGIWAEDSCKLKAVRRAKAELSRTCQEVVESYYYQNERLMDFSRRKGQNENYGRVLHHRCMNQFRKLTQQYYQDYLAHANRIHR